MESSPSELATRTAPSSYTIQEAESIGAQCVERIKECVDRLRAVPEFVIDAKRMARAAATKQPHWEDTIGPVRLFSVLSEPVLLEEVTAIYCKSVAILGHASQFGGDETLNARDDPWFEGAPQLTEERPSSERSRLVYEILLPLLAALGNCYEILDRVIPGPERPENKAKDSQKPPPPVGMLSLQNYTDVACLLEMTVCSSILPQLPPNVLCPIHERVRHQLPKALAGRLPVPSLLWASKQQQQQQRPATSSVSVDELQSVVSVVGRLLLLDRFRPMLLPRHLADLLAAILYSNELQKQQRDCKDATVSYQWVESRLMGTAFWGQCTKIVAVDPHWQAKTYQILLRKGLDAPSWLRVAISQMLSATAARDLAVIVTVFVHEAVDQDQSAAALRLARALVPTTMADESNKGGNDPYLRAICEQLLEILDSILSDGRMMSLETSTNGAIEGRLRPQHTASIQTVWAVLDRLPERILEGFFYETIVNKDVIHLQLNDESDGYYRSGIHRIVRRFGILFSVLPKSAASFCTSKICGLFFKPLAFQGMRSSNSDKIAFQQTLLGAIVRLAAAPCIFSSTVKEDALLTLRLFVEAMVEANFRVARGKDAAVVIVCGVDVLATSLLYVMAPCNWDLQFLSFEAGHGEGSGILSFEPVCIRREVIHEDSILTKLTDGVDHRASVLIRQIMVDRIKTLKMRDPDATDNYAKDQLASLVFRILLLTYISSQHLDGNVDSASILPEIFGDAGFQLVPLVSLPLLCEACPPESLLRLDGDTGIFEIMRVVFDSAIARFATGESDLAAATSRDMSPALRELSIRLRSAADILLSGFSGEVTGNSFPGEHRFGYADDEMVLSLTSILLSLLVGILELGATQRSVEDEEMLQAFADVLRSLSGLSPCADLGENLTMQTQIAEMASYTAALIGARNAPTDGEDQKQKQDTVLGQISQAEDDLMTDQPPLRARGMVLLRKLANSLGEKRKQRRQEMSVIALEETQDDRHLLRILHVSVNALADPESFVYLAAIHTIVAVAEADSSRVVPLVGNAVATGSIRTEVGEDRLSLEQRAKLTEALIFIVRRRGSFDRELPFLIDLLVSGPKLDEMETNDVDTRSIQAKTHSYFIQGSNQSDDLDEPPDEYWNDVALRVRTGGPLFAAEEGDVVRAARITVVGELVSALVPSITARYCSILIRCCIDTLRLERSRPVRRAGATLARELYGALVREQDDLLDAAIRHEIADVPMGAAMVKGREDVLRNTLQRIIDVDDLNDLSDGKERLHDPASVARCQEAIDLRQEAESGGILVAGRLAVESKLQDESPIARLLNESRGKDKNGASVRIVKIEEL